MGFCLRSASCLPSSFVCSNIISIYIFGDLVPSGSLKVCMPLIRFEIEFADLFDRLFLDQQSD